MIRVTVMQELLPNKKKKHLNSDFSAELPVAERDRAAECGSHEGRPLERRRSSSSSSFGLFDFLTSFSRFPRFSCRSASFVSWT